MSRHENENYIYVNVYSESEDLPLKYDHLRFGASRVHHRRDLPERRTGQLPHQGTSRSAYDLQHHGGEPEPRGRYLR